LNINSYRIASWQRHSLIDVKLAFVAARCLSRLFICLLLLLWHFRQDSEFDGSAPFAATLTQTVLNEIIKSRRILMQSVELKGCKFLDIRDIGSGGGVSSATLRVVECEFRSGGAIFALTGGSTPSTVVISCRVQSGCAIECGDRKPREVSLTSLTFDHLYANIFGCLPSNNFRVAGALHNLSESTAMNCIDLLEVTYGPIDLQMCVLTRSIAANDTGGFWLGNYDKVSAERCIFENCSHVTIK
jgi:hypothetical protein